MRSVSAFGICIILLSTLAMAQSIPTIEQPLIPTAAQPGGASFTLTINGAGFVPTPSGVLFGSTQLTITNATATQLTATVPLANIAAAGTASVLVLSSAGVASNVEFFQIANPASPLFNPAVDYDSGVAGTVETTLVADVNGDGILDLALGLTTPDSGPQVSVLLGNSDGTFQTPAVYGVSDASSLVAGRFTNDGGAVDIVAGSTLLKNNGSGVFTATPLLPGVAGFIPFAVGDFSQNDTLDIAGTMNGNIQILNNNGASSFSLGQSFTGGIKQFGGMLAADFNGDGVLDLAVLDTNSAAPVVTVFIGNTVSGFGAGNPLATSTPAGVVAFTAADFNGDNKQDIALVSNVGNGSQVLVLNGNGDGTFTSGFSEALANPVTGTIVTADFNEDGKLDLATGTYILQGNGDGTFQKPPIDFGGTSEVLATGDFNGDGRPDLAAQAGASVAVLLQQVPAPVVLLSPTTLNFNSQLIGTMSASQPITLSNTGNAALAIASISITGTNAGEFGQTNNCGASLAANTSCTINVTFSPTADGADSASVSITDNAAGSPQAVTLSGTGTGAPGAVLSPPTLIFTTLPVGTTSPTAQSVTLTNNGNVTLTITSIGFTGPSANAFAQTSSSNCGTSLAASASCTINITFTPTSVGTANASLSISDNAAGSPQTVSLTGVGSPFSLTTTCVSLSVVPGQTAIYTVDLAPVGDSTPLVSLSCSGAPTLATCTPSLTSTTLSGAITVQVTATTTPATGFLQYPLRRSNENQVAGLIGLGGITGFVALVVLPGKRRAKPGRRVCGVIFLLCVLATLATLPSCGGTGGVDPPGTAAGTYPLTVTGTFQPEDEAAITEQVSFNLVVK